MGFFLLLDNLLSAGRKGFSVSSVPEQPFVWPPWKAVHDPGYGELLFFVTMSLFYLDTDMKVFWISNSNRNGKIFLSVILSLFIVCILGFFFTSAQAGFCHRFASLQELLVLRDPVIFFFAVASCRPNQTKVQCSVHPSEVNSSKSYAIPSWISCGVLSCWVVLWAG